MATGMTARMWLVAAVVLVGLLAVACAPPGGGYDPGTPSVAPSTGQAGAPHPEVARTRDALVNALGTRNLVLQDTEAPFRPPEDPTFTVTPRTVYQVILPEAPSEGFIVVYAFPDPAAAASAATAQAAYLATGPARVQSAFGARHVLRVVGSTVVLYSWVPDGVVDQRQRDIQPALETIGVGVPIPA